MQKALDTLLMIRFASDYRQRLNELRQIITTRYWLLTSCPAGKQELAKKGGKWQHKSKWWIQWSYPSCLLRREWKHAQALPLSELQPWMTSGSICPRVEIFILKIFTEYYTIHKKDYATSTFSCSSMCTYYILTSDFQWIFLVILQNTLRGGLLFLLGKTSYFCSKTHNGSRHS